MNYEGHKGHEVKDKTLCVLRVLGGENSILRDEK